MLLHFIVQLVESQENKEVVDHGPEDGDDDRLGHGEVAHGAERSLLANDNQH